MDIGELIVRSIENISVIYFVISLTFYLVDGNRFLTVESAWWKRVLFGVVFGLVAELLTFTAIMIDESSLTYSFIPIFICFYIAGPLSGISSFVVMYLLAYGGTIHWFNMVYYLSLIAFMLVIKSWKNNSTKQFSLHLLLAIIYSTFIFSLFYPEIWHSVDILLFQFFCYISSVVCYYFVNQQRTYFFSHVQLIEESKKDFLTNMYNRNYLVKTLRKWDLKKRKYSVLILDIDHFKSINDRYGHLAGDQVLRQFSSVIRKMVSKKTLCFRYGGEEFIILIPQGTLTDAIETADYLREVIVHTPFVISEDESIEITTSIGIALKTETTQDYTKIIEHADQALYEAKELGRNRVEFWEDLPIK